MKAESFFFFFPRPLSPCVDYRLVGAPTDALFDLNFLGLLTLPCNPPLLLVCLLKISRIGSGASARSRGACARVPDGSCGIYPHLSTVFFLALWLPLCVPFHGPGSVDARVAPSLCHAQASNFFRFFLNFHPTPSSERLLLVCALSGILTLQTGTLHTSTSYAAGRLQAAQHTEVRSLQS